MVAVMSEYIKKCVRTYLTIYFKMVFIKCQLFLNKENYYFEKRRAKFYRSRYKGAKRMGTG